MVGAKDEVGVFGHEDGEEVEGDVHYACCEEAVDDQGVLGIPAAVAGVGGGWKDGHVDWSTVWDRSLRGDFGTRDGGDGVVPAWY